MIIFFFEKAFANDEICLQFFEQLVANCIKLVFKIVEEVVIEI